MTTPAAGGDGPEIGPEIPVTPDDAPAHNPDTSPEGPGPGPDAEPLETHSGTGNSSQGGIHAQKVKAGRKGGEAPSR